MPKEKEIVICAAVKMPDGFVVRGHRHADCYRNLSERPRYKDAIFGDTEEGFITSKNRFVTREEGRKLQDAAGIPSADKYGYRGDTLFSEDLY
jgi:hypothetical protein